jgi:hypothetical protein
MATQVSKDANEVKKASLNNDAKKHALYGRAALMPQ